MPAGGCVTDPVRWGPPWPLVPETASLLTPSEDIFALLSLHVKHRPKWQAKVAEGPGQQNDDRAGAWLGVWAGVAAPAQVARLVRHRHGVMPAARQNVAIKDMEESGSGQLEVWSAFALE